jgi:hypothetical protein
LSQPRSLQGSASPSWRLDGGCRARGIPVALQVSVTSPASDEHRHPVRRQRPGPPHRVPGALARGGFSTGEAARTHGRLPSVPREEPAALVPGPGPAMKKSATRHPLAHDLAER